MRGRKILGEVLLLQSTYLTVKPSSVSAAAGVLLFAATSAHAITVSGSTPNSNLSFSYSPGDNSGVVELNIVRSDLGPGVVTCSGALLRDGVTILTAAHCIADQTGTQEATSAYVTFGLPGSAYTSSAVGFQVDPGYNGLMASSNDIALLTLAASAPADAGRYSLYFGDPVGQTMTLAGYGFGGTGATGYDPINYPLGTLRVGENQYDGVSPSGDLLFDFDDGTAAHDALGSGLGLGAAEAFIAPGDSGGPSFIGGQIAGVHSFVARLPNQPNRSNTDVDSVLDSSFGEFAGDAGVANARGFLQAFADPVPEPKTMFLVGVGLVLVGLVGEKRRRK